MHENRHRLWIAFVLAFIAGVIVTVIPVWIIQPFRPQTESSVQTAYFLRSISRFVTVLSIGVGVACLGMLWRKTRIWKKVLAIPVVLILLVFGWFAFQNHFEWMFRPLPNPAFARAHEADFLGPQDMVLAVENNREAAAYPVRLMAYHHIVQDVVGGLPLVATY